MSYETTPVRFVSGDGECVGDLHLPGQTAEAPVVVMAHGLGAERAFGLAPIARRFADRGLAALVFDYRTFGDSPGEPRSLVSPRRHVRDYGAALEFVRRDPRLDADRVGLWGTSLSGGHVLVAAARWPEGIRAVVAQVPFVSGVSSALAYPKRHLPKATVLGLADALAAGLGRGPVRVPVVSREGVSVVAAPGAYEGYMSLVPEGTDWTGRVPARILLTILGYRPLGAAARIRAPVLLVAGRDDPVCPIGAVRKAKRRIPDCRLEEMPIGHFDVYHGEWLDRACELEAGFLAGALGPVRPAPGAP